jgi:hypothetical protein
VNRICLEFEALTAVTVMNAVFWDVASCGFVINRRFGGTCQLYLHHSNRLTLVLVRVMYYSLKMEATRSFGTSVYNKPTILVIPGSG